MPAFFIAGIGQSSFQSNNINLSDGLSDLRVQDIVQDKYGYLWFATSFGLNRYDGYNIRTFYSDTSRKSLPSNGVYSLYTDIKGDLWVGTDKGLAKYNPINQDFIRFDSLDGTRSSFIRVITEDQDGNLYIAGSNGIFKYNRDKNTWTNLSKAFHMQKELSFVRGLYFKDKNTLYVTTEKRGFYKLKLKTFQNELIFFQDSRNNVCMWDALMYDMEPLGKDELLITFLGAGIMAYHMQTGAFRAISGPFLKTETVYWNTVYKTYRDKQNRIWIASLQYGLCEYLEPKDSIISYLNNEQLPYGLKSGAVNCIYQDRQNNLWVGSREQGIFKFNPSQQKVFFYDQSDYQKAKLQGTSVNSITELDSETAIVGQLKGFSLFHLKTKTFTNYPGDAINNGTNFLGRVKTVSTDSNNYLWFGTGGLGFMRWKKGQAFTRNMSRSRDGKTGYLDDFISQNIVLSDGNYFYLGLGRICWLNPILFTSRTYKNTTDSIYKITGIHFIYNTGGDQILILKSNGDFFIYDYTHNSIGILNTVLKRAYPGIQVSKMNQDSLGNYWFASNMGLVLLRPDSSTHLYKMESGINENFAVTGFQRIDQTMWITNSRRLGRLNLETEKIHFLTEADGFYNKQLIGSTLTRLSNGNIYLGCLDGIYEILPDHIVDTPKQYAPKLISFTLFNEDPIPLCLEDSCVLKLNYDQNYFSFQLSAFDFCESRELRFAYLLQGFDRDWNEMGNDRMGFYTNVDPGNYILKFRVRNISGDWGEGIQRMYIQISPPFWKTNLFLVLLVFFIVSIVYWFLRFRIQTIQREERLRSEFEIKLHELENSALRTQMNPHFIFNCLNTINAFVQKNDRSNAGLMISKFSKLIRMILNHSRQKRISLKEELEALELYMQIESTRFESKFEYEIYIEPDIYPDVIEFPSLILQPFVENAILHGLLPLKSKGLLNIKIYKREHNLLCIIEDNGIGRQAAQSLRQNSSQQKSHGLDITLKRIELFNQENGYNESVKIIDLVSTEGIPLGTRIEMPIALCFSF
ncbi:MAG: histidine kinase [Saprospiraceae bacterium]|nr:histidine kinase [Saprospiraceae bacterium]